MSQERIEAELDLLTSWFGSDLEYRIDGHWVRLREYAIPSNVWTPRIVAICFQIPEQIPGQAPYAFYVHPCVAATNSAVIGNYEYPVATPFGAEWGKFSWSPAAWLPGANPQDGSNILEFARSFAARFLEGP